MKAYLLLAACLLFGLANLLLSRIEAETWMAVVQFVAGVISIAGFGAVWSVIALRERRQ